MDTDSHKKTLAMLNPRWGIMINLALALNSTLFLVGIFSPILTLDRMFFWSNTVTVVSGIWDLLKEGYPVLFLILFLFSLVLPLAKLITLSLIWNTRLGLGAVGGKCLHLLEEFGKWSMLDVFVVAVIVISVKLGEIASVTIRYGIYLFIASIFTTLILASLIRKKLINAQGLNSEVESD
jgi:paraquat-inducible protein A